MEVPVTIAASSQSSAGRRNLVTVDELAQAYRRPKTSLYDYLRAHPSAGVLKIGKRILVDVDEFDAYVRGAT
jgi:hypothetical protein